MNARAADHRELQGLRGELENMVSKERALLDELDTLLQERDGFVEQLDLLTSESAELRGKMSQGVWALEDALKFGKRDLMSTGSAASALANNATILRVLQAFDWRPDS
mmetsp:Transcript_23890/g.54245  ORF Transcript_23890/g.54245 Transcript_23890/m.54245 type:complete len:108 (+) Transcript_23890:61-384(+)